MTYLGLSHRSIAIYFVAAFFCSSVLACRTTIPAAPLENLSQSIESGPSADYLLGAGDELRIRSVGDVTFDGDYQISESGNINLPIAGDVRVGSKSLSEASAEIEKAIAQFVNAPKIALNLTSRRSNRAYFGGEFVRVGLVPIELPTNLLSGIALAGGLTPFASGRIVLIRMKSDGTTQRYAADYKDIESGLHQFDTVLIKRGDVIIAE